MDKHQVFCDVIAMMSQAFPDLGISANSEWIYVGRRSIMISEDDEVNIIELCEAIKEQKCYENI